MEYGKTVVIDVSESTVRALKMVAIICLILLCAQVLKIVLLRFTAPKSIAAQWKWPDDPQRARGPRTDAVKKYWQDVRKDIEESFPDSDKNREKKKPVKDKASGKKKDASNKKASNKTGSGKKNKSEGSGSGKSEAEK